MRFIIACLIAFGVIGGAIALPPEVVESGYAVAFAQQPPTDVNVDINADGGGAWWSNPVWIAIGVLALIVLIAIIATASRGGGTTVIKD